MQAEPCSTYICIYRLFFESIRRFHESKHNLFVHVFPWLQTGVYSQKHDTPYIPCDIGLLQDTGLTVTMLPLEAGLFQLYVASVSSSTHLCALSPG